jgi:hypothetical protein
VATSGYPYLNQGTYRGVVEIRDLAAPRVLVRVPVTLALGNGRGTPTVAARPRSLTLRLGPGGSRRVDLVLSDASRTCGYAYSLQATHPWVTMNPYLRAGRVGRLPARSAPRASDTGQGNGFVPLTISARRLSSGVHRAGVVIQSQDAVHNPTRVNITLRVGPLRPRAQSARSRSAPGFTG